jgi:hypothetical protein
MKIGPLNITPETPAREIKAIRILRSHCLGGGIDVEEGTILKVPDEILPEEAKRKIQIEYAEAVELEAPATKKHPDADVDVINPDPDAENRDPNAPAKTAGKRGPKAGK